MSEIRLPSDWKHHLAGEFEQPYMKKLKGFLQHQIKAHKIIYPPFKECFSSFFHCSFENIKVVILGQDPYHGPGQAHGLCFSVPPSQRIPPSLENIFKEINQDLGFPPARHGCLISWAKQGVLLLNAVLSVEKGRAGSHQNQGWEIFTDRIIQLLNREKKHLVFMLWGRYAQDKAGFVDQEKHLVLKAPHPSPFSAASGFFGCKHFSKANTYLQQKGLKPVDWRVPEESAV